MKLNTNSNVYTIVYASVTVIVVAFLLAFVSLALHETQQKNIDNDKRSQILAAIGQRGIASDQVEAAFDKAVLCQLVLNAKGDSVGNDAFSIENKAITDDNLPLYICQTGTDTLYVIPLTGRGLWGGLWGYISSSPTSRPWQVPTSLMRARPLALVPASSRKTSKTNLSARRPLQILTSARWCSASPRRWKIPPLT